MLSGTAKIRQVLVVLIQVTLLSLVSSAASAQQSIVENIKPMGQVCLAGQSCVGSIGGNGRRVRASEVAPVAVQESVVEVEPIVAAVDAEPAIADFDAAASYQMSCFACHSSGAAGAPVVGDQEAWSERLEKGMDGVMANVINGVNAMPAKGMCMTCSNDNLRVLVDYMVSQ